MKIALAQINPTIGDLAANTARILQFAHDAAAGGAEIVAFCEQCLLGYPARDLLLRPSLIDAQTAALEEILARGPRIPMLVGAALPRPAGAPGRALDNAALLLDARGNHTWRKRLLPNYDVFEEARYFEPASAAQPVAHLRRWEQPDFTLGVAICEDLLAEADGARPRYAHDPVAEQAAGGADLILCPAASPFALGKQRWREERAAQDARINRRPIAIINQVGAHDGIIFDGASCLLGPDGRLLARAASFAEDLLIVDLHADRTQRVEPAPQEEAALHAALVLGIRDYVRKCGFERVLLGLSGGIDSAVVACLAVAALGADKVRGVGLPSRYSSPHSLEDARALAQNLGIRFCVLPIETAHAALEQTLREHLAGRPADATEENLQARLRGLLLMALSNRSNDLLLATGNKSELAAGYCTLYGDMCGAMLPLGDVLKTQVQALARWINDQAGRALIPLRTLQKPPSAELRPNQTDQDTLPPYEVLDAIVQLLEERGQTVEEVVSAGFERPTVERIARQIQLAEYKRQQAGPLLKVSARTFGVGRKMPIAARPPLP